MHLDRLWFMVIMYLESCTNWPAYHDIYTFLQHVFIYKSALFHTLSLYVQCLQLFIMITWTDEWLMQLSKMYFIIHFLFTYLISIPCYRLIKQINCLTGMAGHIDVIEWWKGFNGFLHIKRDFRSRLYTWYIGFVLKRYIHMWSFEPNSF